MMKTIRKISYLLLVISILPILSSCNNEDDVVKIFTGKTWKMTFIAKEGSKEQYNFWGEQGMTSENAAYKNSMDALAKEGNFILNFEGGDLNGTAGGSFGGRASTTSVSGTWNANGESKRLDITVEGKPVDKDVYGKAFITGLQNAIRYGGDENNLYIYYKDGQTTKFLAFHPQ